MKVVEGSMKADQRQFSRYIVQQDVFNVFNRDSKIIGNLRNISMGGLAFQYTPIVGEGAESKTVDILGTGPDGFHLRGIACRTIYDINVLAEERTFRGAETRLRGLQYAGLTQDQKAKLENLLDNYVFGPADSAR